MQTAAAPQTPAPKPVIFEEFFELGLPESGSPFLTPDSRIWGINLTLKSAIAATFLLAAAFILSFIKQGQLISNFLLIFVYFLVGIPALIEAIEDLLRFEINIDILMTLAAFSSVLIGSAMEGALLLVLFALSGSMEDAVTAKAKNSISSLHKLSPSKACVVEEDGTIIERAIKSVPVGAHILVKSGQVVPLDGIVTKGISSVNLVHLTGENFPVTKKVEDKVAAGARNLEGALTLRVISTSAESTLSKIIQLVTQAQEARPALQRWFDKISRKYAITIIFLSAFFALSLPFILNIPFLGTEGSVYRALAFLIAASPCALIIAIPIAYLSAVSVCAKRGILLKGGITLDALASCHSMAFDKTGTLTTGDLTCEKMEGLTTNDPDKIKRAIEIACALEKNAVHPIAKGILEFGQKNQAQLVDIQNFRSVPGYGLEGFVQSREGKPSQAYIGRADYILDKINSQQAALLLRKTEEIKEQGSLLTVLLLENELYIFRFRDTPRLKIRDTLSSIKKRGWKIYMLTGDHEENARTIAQELGIDTYKADLTPEDKLNLVSELSSKQGLTMVGDGVNDAPALARATVGVCMGKIGSTAAIDAADVVLLHDNIELLDWLIGKAYQTQTIVKQNLTLATLAIFAASLPALGGFIPLWLAVVMHEGGTVLVGLNALRLLRK